MAERRMRHLYLLFDDWHSGFSIRKVSLSRRSGKQPLSSGSGKEGVEPVPELFMHIRAPRGFPDLFTSAFGTKIMAMHTAMADDTPGIPMIDIKEQALTIGPYPCTYHSFPICFPVGDKRLFVLDSGAFDVYLWAPEHSEQPWRSHPLRRPPLNSADVSSYGVLPDGCILISTADRFGDRGARTFMCDTVNEGYMWELYGNWALPFTGRGHFDTNLEAFVGLSEDGYLCCITIPAIISTITSPDVKRTKEKVYTERQHISATLVHMGQGKFCLVECVSVGNKTGQDIWDECDDEFMLPPVHDMSDFVGGGPQGGRCMYRLKTFNLSYDPKEDCLKLKNCKVRCYSLPHEARIGSVCMDPVAFWL